MGQAHWTIVSGMISQSLEQVCVHHAGQVAAECSGQLWENTCGRLVIKTPGFRFSPVKTEVLGQPWKTQFWFGVSHLNDNVGKWGGSQEAHVGTAGYPGC